MDDSALFFKSILDAVPENSKCYFQSPHEEFLDGIRDSGYFMEGIFIAVILTEKNKLILAGIADHNLHDYVQYAKFEYNKEKLIEAYDGFEYGLVSKNFIIQGSAFEKCIEIGSCGVSEDW